MTPNQWLELQVGDDIIDHKHNNAVREILSISRVSGRHGQRGKTRTMVTVPNLKTRDHDATTHLSSSQDIPNGSRFSLAPRARGSAQQPAVLPPAIAQDALAQLWSEYDGSGAQLIDVTATARQQLVDEGVVVDAEAWLAEDREP